MARLIVLAAFAAACCGLAGCSETTQRVHGVTPGAGEAIAANTVMQMVDPWLYGVQDTDLSVPADRTSEQQRVLAESSDNQQAPSTTGN